MKYNVHDSIKLALSRRFVDDKSLYPWWLRSVWYFRYLEDNVGIGFVGSTGSINDINDYGYYDYVLFACVI